MKKFFTELNIAFAAQLAVILFVIFDILPRETLLLSGGMLVVFALKNSIEESVFLIARCIPLFTALPFTSNFDSFNVWRFIVLIIFIKWIWRYDVLAKALGALSDIFEKAKSNIRAAVVFAYKNWRIEFLCAILLLMSLLSLAKADDVLVGVKKIIYFMNRGMLFFVVRAVANKNNLNKIAFNALLSGALIVFIGFVQLASTYYMGVDDFSEFWALKVEKTLYGTAWANIAISANTWFAYFNGTIHLRMFSSFPDSHSFPLYLLIVSVFVSTFIVFKKTISQSCLPAYFLLGIFSLGIVLSGTRGIWAATALPILIIGFYYFKKIAPKEFILKLTLPLIFFIVALIISQPIFNSKQFQLIENETEESRVLINRLASIFDAGETSNQGRIWIWKESAKSIIKNPALGVGIGNFPAVLKQNIALAKAGSSAHNLFLQILAEIGIFAFAVFLAIIYEIYKKIKNLSQDENVLIKFFGLFSILYIAWIIAYSMTDPAIFDDRVFLGLMILVGAIYGISRERKIF